MASAASEAAGVRVDPSARARASDAYGRLPLSFEANHGQTDERVRFVSRGQGYTPFLTPTEAVLRLRKADARAEGEGETGGGDDDASGVALKRRAAATEGVLRVGLVGGNAAPRVTGRDELPGRGNYFTGGDARAWRTNVPSYERIEYEGV